MLLQILKVQQSHFLHSRLCVCEVICFSDGSDGSFLNSYNTLLVLIAAAAPNCLAILDMRLDKRIVEQLKR